MVVHAVHCACGAVYDSNIHKVCPHCNLDPADIEAFLASWGNREAKTRFTAETYPKGGA